MRRAALILALFICGFANADLSISPGDKTTSANGRFELEVELVSYNPSSYTFEIREKDGRVVSNGVIDIGLPVVLDLAVSDQGDRFAVACVDDGVWIFDQKGQEIAFVDGDMLLNRIGEKRILCESCTGQWDWAVWSQSLITKRGGDGITVSVGRWHTASISLRDGSVSTSFIGSSGRLLFAGMSVILLMVAVSAFLICVLAWSANRWLDRRAHAKR